MAHTHETFANACCATCKKQLHITGDGSHPHRMTIHGGVVFCDRNCNEKWVEEDAINIVVTGGAGPDLRFTSMADYLLHLQNTNI